MNSPGGREALPGGIKKRIRVKGNAMGGQRLRQTSRGTEAVRTVRVQPTWVGGARLCRASCRKAFLQKAQQVTLQVRATNSHKNQRTARKM